MQVEITIDEPLDKVVEDRDFFEERIIKRFGTFRPVDSNIYGIRRRAIDERGITDARKGNISVLQEIGPNGIVEHRFDTYNFHIIAGGTPHRVTHSFGFWHINDMEELSVKFPGNEGEPGYSLVIMGKPEGKEGDSYAWYCEQCLTMLYEMPVRTGERGLGEFFRLEREAIRIYNAGSTLRTCPECGHLNPHAYSWDPKKDTTPEESQARTLW